MTINYAYMSTVVQIPDPNSFEETKAKKKWVNVMQEEIDALGENKTWDLVKLPNGKNVVGCKWVYGTSKSGSSSDSFELAKESMIPMVMYVGIKQDLLQRDTLKCKELIMMRHLQRLQKWQP